MTVHAFHRIVLASLSLALVGLVTLLPARALAAGNLTLMTKEVGEKDGEWHMKVRIDLARAPGMMHIPMRFTFSKEAVDERQILSKGADPVHRRVVLEVAQKTVVGMDIDFADPSGKVWKTTTFEFDLRRRDNFFEAGEYTMKLSGPDGDVGGAQRVTLKGDNAPVYRGAMDFSDSKGASKAQKGPKMQDVSNDVDAGTKVASNDTPAATPMAAEVAAEGSGGSLVPGSAYSKTAEEEAVKDRPSGCGCVAAGSTAETKMGASGALLGLALLVARRRRPCSSTRAPSAPLVPLARDPAGRN